MQGGECCVCPAHQEAHEAVSRMRRAVCPHLGLHTDVVSRVPPHSPIGPARCTRRLYTILNARSGFAKAWWHRNENAKVRKLVVQPHPGLPAKTPATNEPTLCRTMIFTGRYVIAWTMKHSERKCNKYMDPHFTWKVFNV